MSIMRQKLGGAIANSAKNVARMAAPTGAASNDLTDNWLHRLNDSATTADSKEGHS